MIDEKYELIKNGISIKEITELEENIEITIDAILREFEYSPRNREGLSRELRGELYRHIIELAQRSDDDIVKTFNELKKDYNDSPNGYAKSSMSIIIGSRIPQDFEDNDIKEDILNISNHMMEQRYTDSR
jgi:hypothetical protein